MFAQITENASNGRRASLIHSLLAMVTISVCLKILSICVPSASNWPKPIARADSSRSRESNSQFVGSLTIWMCSFGWIASCNSIKAVRNGGIPTIIIIDQGICLYWRVWWFSESEWLSKKHLPISLNMIFPPELGYVCWFDAGTVYVLAYDPSESMPKCNVIVSRFTKQWAAVTTHLFDRAQ